MSLHVLQALHQLLGGQPVPLTKQRRLGNTGNPLSFPASQQHGYEDQALVNGPQLAHPINMDVGQMSGNSDAPQGGYGFGGQNFNTVQPQLQAPRTYWQNTDQRRRNMVNPQVQDNGYRYF